MTRPTTDIAITGIDCRFPGAPGKDEFWQLLVRGQDGVAPIPTDRWDVAAYFSEQPAPGRMNAREGGFITDPDAFDNHFFGITPREAAALDPQQRILLQCAWRAFEDAGIDPRGLARSRTGVFVGIMGNEWAHLQMADYKQITPHVGSGNGYCMTANRVSYHLDLTGPSVAVDTACSSSLVALHQACLALRADECDLALVAGVNMILTPALHIFYTQAGLSAPDGRCKPFSAQGNGIGRAEGVGAVVLRRVDEAFADGDNVYAVVRGSAVNHDGRSNGITAPNRWAQVDVIERACAAADVSPQEIGFVEAHGTGTVLGDMIEAKALGQLHAGRDEPCLLGSVKSNIGHAEGAAGIAGLIKAVLALHHRTLPPSRVTGAPNPQLRLEQHGLRLATEPTPLSGELVLGAVSSFGLGGTNAHVVLASAPAPAPGKTPDGKTGTTIRTEGGSDQIFTLSGNDLAAVRRNADAAAAYLRARNDEFLTEACRANNRVKSSLPWKLAVTGRTATDLANALASVAADATTAERLVHKPAGAPRIGFVFTGQGSQHPGMTRDLLADSEHYRRLLVEADAALAPHLHRSVVEVICSESEEVADTELAQPAIFAVEYALGQMLMDYGLTPQVMLGHSIGEYAAACLSGVLSLDDAARLVVRRGALMQALPDCGGMLAVRLGADDAAGLVATEDRVAVAAVNGPRSVVLSGDLTRLDALAAELERRGVPTRRLPVSHAFHSPLMAPMLGAFAEETRAVHYGESKLAIVSTVTGEVLSTPMDADYWVDHVSLPVRFTDAVETARRHGITHLVEIGPRSVLTPMIRHLPAAQDITALSATTATGVVRLPALVGELYVAGARPFWDALYPADLRATQRPLPYAFAADTRFWPGERPRPSPPLTTGSVSTAANAQPPSSDESREVHSQVVDAIRNVCGHDASRIRPDTRLYEDLGFDSVMVIELKNNLERRLPTGGSINITALLPNLATVADLVRFLEERSPVLTTSSKVTQR